MGLRSYDLDSAWGLSNYSWADRNESDRFNRLVKKWRAENPSAKVEHQIIAENLFRCAILLQRVMDKRKTFDCAPTDYHKDGSHNYTMSAEFVESKRKEFDRLYNSLSDQLRKWISLALCQNISIDMSGTRGSITALFRAHDESVKGKDAGDTFT